MTDNHSDSPRVLVPVTILEGGTVPPGVVDLLSDVHTVVLGYHELPEQTAPGQARMQFADRAEALLDDIADQFREVGASVETRLVFTNDAEKTVGRVANETGCDATLVVQPAPAVDHIYVALGDPDEADSVGRVLAGVLPGVDADVSLRYFLRDSDPGAAEETLGAVTDRLAEAGVDRDRVDSATREGGKTVANIVEDADDVDVVVIADPDLSLGEFVFGDIEERIAGQLLAPVLVVRKRSPEREDGGETGEGSDGAE